MRRLSKIICFGVLPTISLLIFIFIGAQQTYREYFSNNSHLPMHHAMSTDIFMFLWIERGVYAALIVLASSFVLYSVVSKKRKALIFCLLIFLNSPLIYLMCVGISLPELFIVIIIVNLLALAPVCTKANKRAN